MPRRRDSLELSLSPNSMAARRLAINNTDTPNNNNMNINGDDETDEGHNGTSSSHSSTSSTTNVTNVGTPRRARISQRVTVNVLTPEKSSDEDSPLLMENKKVFLLYYFF